MMIVCRKMWISGLLVCPNCSILSILCMWHQTWTGQRSLSRTKGERAYSILFEHRSSPGHMKHTIQCLHLAAAATGAAGVHIQRQSKHAPKSCIKEYRGESSHRFQNAVAPIAGSVKACRPDTRCQVKSTLKHTSRPPCMKAAARRLSFAVTGMSSK